MGMGVSSCYLRSCCACARLALIVDVQCRSCIKQTVVLSNAHVQGFLRCLHQSHCFQPRQLCVHVLALIHNIKHLYTQTRTPSHSQTQPCWHWCACRQQQFAVLADAGLPLHACDLPIQAPSSPFSAAARAAAAATGSFKRSGAAELWQPATHPAKAGAGTRGATSAPAVP